MASRAQPTPLSEWWRTVDRLTLAALGALMLGGIVLCLAASPPVAARLGLDPFHFVNRQVFFLVPAAAVLVATSFLPPREIRRFALIVFMVSLMLVAATPYFGAEIKGARRWLVILGVNVQPSEFLKPAFVILIAWLFGESGKRPEMPANTVALVLLVAVIGLLVLQPDFGQTMLITLVWGALFYMAGMRFIWMVGLGATAAIGLTTAFYTVPHVAQRINRFLDPSSGDTFNIDIATESFVRGGWFGRGPGEGTIKRILRRPYRFRVRRGRGGIRRRALPQSRGIVRLHRDPRAHQGDAQQRPVHPFCRRRAGDPVRTAVDHQHGGESAPDAGQGHDVAVRLLWRLVTDLARLWHGHADRVDTRAPARPFVRGHAARPENRLMPEPDRAPVLLAAGGTGGHLFPAEALAAALTRHGFMVHLATDRRAARYGEAFAEEAVHVIASATLRARNPIAMARTGAMLGRGFLQALALIGRLKPAAVVGFGGYPTIPPVLAAVWRGVPTVIHDANAVIGRANRFLAPRVTAIATTFPDVFRNHPELAAKAKLTGNPVRPAVVAAASTPYPASDKRLRVLVVGGSQGARILADVVPVAIGRLGTDLRMRLSVVQQAREEDLDRVRNAYASLAVTAEVAPFFSDLPARMAASHLVVSRSGASTVAELAAIGRPAILIPLPHALDQDQLANAGVLEVAGGAIRVVQKDFTPRRLAADIAALAESGPRLAAMAAAARSLGRLDAADQLAALVLNVAGIGPRT
jgi:UDP-N-acetylglucosamine--N-acetylmuramyl-(pentapeptide) pyrophosphoryl-undecaprenol N-acetylglucosamine transferase